MLTPEKIPKYDSQIYTKIALNDLVTYAVYFLTQIGCQVSSENITAACYLLFPQRFSMRTYTQWPDSTVVNKRWIDCRNKGFITGSTASNFSLTPKGLVLAQKVEKILTGERPIISRPGAINVKSEMRTRAGRFIRALEESDAFGIYKKNGAIDGITEFDFRSMLLCTMESSSSTLRKNLDQFKQYTLEGKRSDLYKFLESIERKFIHLLVQSGDKRGGHGMLQRKKK